MSSTTRDFELQRLLEILAPLPAEEATRYLVEALDLLRAQGSKEPSGPRLEKAQAIATALVRCAGSEGPSPRLMTLTRPELQARLTGTGLAPLRAAFAVLELPGPSIRDDRSELERRFFGNAAETTGEIVEGSPHVAPNRPSKPLFAGAAIACLGLLAGATLLFVNSRAVSTPAGAPAVSAPAPRVQEELAHREPALVPLVRQQTAAKTAQAQKARHRASSSHLSNVDVFGPRR